MLVRKFLFENREGEKNVMRNDTDQIAATDSFGSASSVGNLPSYLQSYWDSRISVVCRKRTITDEFPVYHDFYFL